MAISPDPIDTPPSDLPIRSQRSTFSTRLDAFVTWLCGNVQKYYDVAVNCYGNAVAAYNSAASAANSAASATTKAAEATSSATLANASANFKGSWSGLVGALNVPASTFHNDKYWILLSNLADVTTATPGVHAAWQEVIIDSFGIGDLKQSTATMGASWLKCDGAQYPSASYPTLAAALPITNFDQTDSNATLLGVSSNPGICYNGTSMFVRVDDSGCISSSPDAITWTDRHQNSNAINSITFENNYFIAGTSGGILYSSDAITWTYAQINATRTITEVRYGAGIYCAICTADDRVFTATTINGTWTERTSGLTALDTPNRLFFLNSMFLATCTNAGGAIFTSTDAITWTQRASSGAAAINDIYWSGSLFVAVGAAGACYSSADGATWTSRSAGSNQFYRVHYNGALWCAVGAIACYTSSDGVTWTSRTIPSLTFKALAYGNSKWMAISTTGIVISSSDGTTWTANTAARSMVPGVSQDNWLNTLIYQQSKFVILGDFGTVLTAADAGSATTSRRNKKYLGVAAGYTPSHYDDDNTTLILPAKTGIIKTTDQITWQFIHIAATANIRCVRYLGSLWIALCRTTGIYTSTDGTTWTLRQSCTNFNDVAYNGSNLYVAVGGDATAYKSVDGVTWTSFSLPASTTYEQIVYFSNKWITDGYMSSDATTWIANSHLKTNFYVVGSRLYSLQKNSSIIRYTEDGLIVRLCELRNFSNYGNVNNIAMINGVYVLTTMASTEISAVIWHSADGVTFYPAVVATDIEDDVGSLFVSGGNIYAIGNTRLYISKDGKNWARYRLDYIDGSTSEAKMLETHMLTFAGATVLYASGYAFPVDSSKFRVPELNGDSAPIYIKAA